MCPQGVRKRSLSRLQNAWRITTASFRGVTCCVYNSEVVTDLADAKYVAFIVESFGEEKFDLDTDLDVE